MPRSRNSNTRGELLDKPLILTRASLVTAVETLSVLSAAGSVRVAAIEALETGEQDEARHPSAAPISRCCC